MGYSAAELKRRRRERSKLVTDINVAPFVDVMLVLVVILMVAAPLLKFGMEVNVPEAALVWFGWKPVCADGGRYRFHPGTGVVSCSVHGSLLEL